LCLPFLERFLPLTPLTRRLVLCWPQTVKELASLSLVFRTPRSLGKAGAKVLPFFELASTFFKYFSFILHLADNQREKSSSSLGFSEFWVCF
jgi:hypothetical protein